MESYQINKNIKPWYSFENNGKYEQEDYSVFPLQSFSWKQDIENHFVEIREELNKLIENKDKSIVPYFNRTLANSAEKWTVFPLQFWGKTLVENQNKCKVTSKVLSKIPGLLTAGFSIMSPATQIKAHVGDSNMFFRCHLGLKIPDGGYEKCGLRVGNEKIKWKEGEIFAFCDAQEHEAWNNSDEERWVLIFDVIRPEFENKVKFVCAKMTMIALLQHVFQRFYIFGHLPRWARKHLANTLGYFKKILTRPQA